LVEQGLTSHSTQFRSFRARLNWPVSYSLQIVYRIVSLHAQVQEIAENDNPWIIFVETTDPEKPQAKLPYFEKESKRAVVCRGAPIIVR